MRRLIPNVRYAIGSAVLFLSVTGPAAARAQHQPGPPSAFMPASIDLPGGRVVVPVELVQGARATVRVMVNGRGPFVFGIETGAAFAIMTPDAAARAGVAMNAASAIPIADSMRIGGALLHGQPLTINAQPLPGIDGLLGLPVFARVLLTVDYPRRELVLERGTLGVANGRDVFDAVPLRPGAATPYMAMPIDIAGRKVSGVIDTQSGGAISVSPRFATDSLSFVATPVRTGSAGVGGAMPTPINSARLAGDVRLGDFILPRPILQLVPVAFIDGATIGTQVLRQFRVTLDQVSRRIRLERANRTLPSDPPFHSVGLGLARGESGVAVATVAPRGAAEAAGLKVGDIVVSVGGRAAADVVVPPAFSDMVQLGKPFTVVVRRNGQPVSIDVTPRVIIQ